MRTVTYILLSLIIANSAMAQTTTIDIAPILKSSASKIEKAEKVAREAEKLIHPAGMPFALDLFKVALNLDPKNKLANFYSGYLNVFMHLKGLHTRLLPLLATTGTSLQKFIDRTPELIQSPSLFKFLTMARSDIYTESDLQNYLLATQKSIENFRQYVKANPNLELNLRFADNKNWSDHVADKECTVKPLRAAESYQLSDCLTRNPIDVKVNSADMVMLRGIASGMQLAIAAAVSYELDGLIKTLDQKDALHLSPREMTDRLKKLKFGKLKNEKILKTIPDLGAEMLTAANWALKHQSLTCKTGKKDGANRPDYLFRQGICPSDEQLEFYRSISGATPQPQTYGRWTLPAGADTFEYNEFKSATLPYALVAKPVQDLKTLLPISFDRCGYPAAFPDRTFGGYLPKGDVMQAYYYVAFMRNLGIVPESFYAYENGLYGYANTTDQGICPRR